MDNCLILVCTVGNLSVSVDWTAITCCSLVPLLWGSSAHAGGLLHAPIAQQVVCNELWLFLCLEGNLGLDGGHPQDRDWGCGDHHLGVALRAMEGGKTLQHREYEGLEVMSLLEVHIFSLSDSCISPTLAVGNGDLRVSQCLPETSRYPGDFSLCKH